MAADDTDEITRLLDDWRAGDRGALDRLAERLHGDLRRLARRQMRRERPDHTLDATALVNEAYLRLAAAGDVAWRDRAHFFAVCARVMRHVLVDHARAHARDKRGGATARVPLDEGPALLAPARAAELVALDAALDELEALDERMARVVELRYFVGLGVDETAEALGVSPATVLREWRRARAWLYGSVAGRGARGEDSDGAPRRVEAR